MRPSRQPRPAAPGAGPAGPHDCKHAARQDPAALPLPAHGDKMVGRSLSLYVMLGLTAALFGAQLALSHVTHALTLLVDSYHMLCNLIALSGCIITIKKGLGGGSPPIRSNKVNDNDDASEHATLRDGVRGSAADRRLRNTFGWARIDVLVSLIGTVFLASLCFSLLVEAVQTLLHIDHHDEMHEPLYVAGAGVASLAVNALCYVLLGGYTFHQGSFFHVTEKGDVVLEPAVTEDSVKLGERRLSAQRRPPRSGALHQFRQRQGCREMMRDTVGCVFVIAASLTVFFTDQSVGKYADPIMSIVSALMLLVLSYPYMKEAGLILLQTIPEHINIDELRSDFEKAFPDIVNIHDLHVWRLNQSKVFCTAHVRFRNARDYLRVNQDVTSFFVKYGVTQVTVQPEFVTDGSDDGHGDKGGKGRQGARALCLMCCPGESCLRAHCCAPNPQHYMRIASDLSLPGENGRGSSKLGGHGHSHGHGHGHSHSHGPVARSPTSPKTPSAPPATAPTLSTPSSPEAPAGRKVYVTVEMNKAPSKEDLTVSAEAVEPSAAETSLSTPAAGDAPLPPTGGAESAPAAPAAAQLPAQAEGAADDSKAKQD